MSPRDPISIRTFYRIVLTDPPTIDDVTPKPAPSRIGRPDYERLKTGISVFRTVTQARRTAMDRPPWLGRGYIAAIELPHDAACTIERTTSSRGHYTLWADPHDILSWMIMVEPVTPVGEQ
jgi:hypothetical protein